MYTQVGNSSKPRLDPPFLECPSGYKPPSKGGLQTLASTKNLPAPQAPPLNQGGGGGDQHEILALPTCVYAVAPKRGAEK